MNPLKQDYLALLSRFGLRPPEARPGMSRINRLLEERKAAYITGSNTEEGAEDWRNIEGPRLIDRVLKLAGDKDEDDSSSHWQSLGVDGDHGPLDLYLGMLRISLSVEDVKRLDSVFFGEFPTGDFNAQAIRTSNGYLCLITGGLRRLLFQLSMTATLLLPSPDADGAREAPDQGTRRLAAAFGAYAAYQTFLGQPKDVPYLPDSRTRFRDLAAGHLTTCMKSFVTAHEVGHIVLGHLDTGVTMPLAVLGGTVEVVPKAHQREFEADAYAQSALALLDRQLGNLQLPWSVAAGGVCFLMASQIVDTVASKLSQTPPSGSSTHPPDHLRIERLLSILESTVVGDAVGPTKVLIGCMDQLRRLVHATTVEHTSDGISIGLTGITS